MPHDTRWRRSAWSVPYLEPPICAPASRREPEAAARLIVEGGFTERYEYALRTLTENPYGACREYDAEDTIRFYALRMHELGMIKTVRRRSSPTARIGAS